MDKSIDIKLIAVLVVAVIAIAAGAALLLTGGGDDQSDVEYQLTYNVNGGDEISSVTYTKNTPTFSLTIPVKAEAEFLGWYEDSKFSGTPITKITQGTEKSITVWAKWKVEKTDIPSVDDIENNSEVIITVDEDTSTSIPSDVIDAISEGKSLVINNVDINDNVVLSWTFNGSDTKVEGYDGNPVDIVVVPDTSKLDTDKKVVLQFNHSGKLPYESTIRYFVGLAYADMEMAVWNGTDAPIGYFTVDETGYIEFDIDHCSDWNIQQCVSFVFDANGGTIDGQATVKIKGLYGSEFDIGDISTPTLPGSEFDGWEPSVPETFVADTAFTAKWKVKEYNITYNLNGGEFIDHSYTDKYTYGQSVTLPTSSIISKAGCEFVGWYDNAELSGNVVTEIPAGQTGDKKFWAKWNLTTYTVKYFDGSTELSELEQSYTIETPTFNLNTYEKNAYNFVGWYDNRTFDGDSVSSITEGTHGNKVFYAKLNPITYTITYMDGATELGTAEYDITQTPYTLSTTYSKEGKAFSCWKDEAGTDVSVLVEGTYGNKTFYAQWEDYYVQVTVLIDDEPSSGPVKSDVIIDSGDSSVAMVRISNGVYKIADSESFHIVEDGVYTILVDGIEVTEVTVEDGRGLINVIFHTVSFDVQEDDQYVLHGGLAVEPEAPTAIGKTFLYWGNVFSDEYDFDTPVTTSIFLFAEWEMHVYNVRYDKNNAEATGTMDMAEATFDRSFQADECGFSLVISDVTWRFVSWNTMPNGMGVSVNAGESLFIDEDIIADIENNEIVLYALWTNVSYNPIKGDLFSGSYAVTTPQGNANMNVKCMVVSVGSRSYMAETLYYENSQWTTQGYSSSESGTWPIFDDFFDDLGIEILITGTSTSVTDRVNGADVAATRYSNQYYSGLPIYVSIDVVDDTGMICRISVSYTVTEQMAESEFPAGEYSFVVIIDSYVSGTSENKNVSYKLDANSGESIQRTGSTYVDPSDLGFSVEGKAFAGWFLMSDGEEYGPFNPNDAIAGDRTVYGKWEAPRTNVNWTINQLIDGIDFIHNGDGDALWADVEIGDIITLAGTTEWAIFDDEYDDAIEYSFVFDGKTYHLCVHIDARREVGYYQYVFNEDAVRTEIVDGQLNIIINHALDDKFDVFIEFLMDPPNLKGYWPTVGDYFIYRVDGDNVRYDVINVPGSDGWGYDDEYQYRKTPAVGSPSEHRADLFDYPEYISNWREVWRESVYTFGNVDVPCYIFGGKDFVQKDGTRTITTNEYIIGINDGLLYRSSSYELLEKQISAEPIAKYDVLFDGNGGLVYGQPTNLIRDIFIITVPDQQVFRQGMQFLGWALTENGEPIYHEGDLIQGIERLYAKWDFNGSYVRVDLQGGESSEDLELLIDQNTAQSNYAIKLLSDSIHSTKGDQVGIGFKIHGATDERVTDVIFTSVSFVYHDRNNIQNYHVEVAPNVYVESTYLSYINLYKDSTTSPVIFIIVRGETLVLDMQYGEGATITYLPNGGTPDTPLVLRGPLNGLCALPDEDTFNMENQRFKGWYYEGPYGTTKANIAYNNQGSAEVTLYAVFEPYVNIHYETGTDQRIEDTTAVADGVTKKLISSGSVWMAIEGMEFIGWTLDLESNTIDYLPGVSVTFDPSISGSNLTLYAVWVPVDDVFDVKFNKGDNNPSGWGVTTQKLAPGISMRLPKASYTSSSLNFNGWNTAIDGTGTSYQPGNTICLDSKPASGEFILYAQWVGLIVNFDSDGGTGSMNSQEVVYGQQWEIPDCDFVREGFVFGGWNCDPHVGGNNYPSVLPNGNVYYLLPIDDSFASCTLTPVWLPVYTVSFDTGGAGVIPSQSVVDGQYAHEPEDQPTKQGYEFDGYNTDPVIPSEFNFNDTPIHQNTTIYVHWLPMKYNLSYDIYGGVIEENYEYNYNDELVYDNYFQIRNDDHIIAPEGYLFGGRWFIEIDEERTYYEAGAQMVNLCYFEDGHLNEYTLYAEWVPITYTVQFNANGGSGSMNNLSRQYDDEQELPECSFTAPAGMVFDYGCTTQDGEGDIYWPDSTDNLTTENGATVILYAIWCESW